MPLLKTPEDGDPPQKPSSWPGGSPRPAAAPSLSSSWIHRTVRYANPARPSLPRTRLLAENGKEGARLKRERGRAAGHQLLQTSPACSSAVAWRQPYGPTRQAISTLRGGQLMSQRAHSLKRQIRIQKKKRDGEAKRLLLLRHSISQVIVAGSSTPSVS